MITRLINAVARSCSSSADIWLFKVLYINLGCPWASRTNLVRSLKGLEDLIQVVTMDCVMTEKGWCVDFLLPI